MLTSNGSAAARTYLFVPADRTERYAKAFDTGADAVVIDLEDAVGPSAKRSAREQLASWLDSSHARPVTVRINGGDTAWHAGDLALCRHSAVVQVMVPKAEDPSALQDTSRVTGKPVLALIETAAGVCKAREIARCGSVVRLVFGSIDLQLDLGMEADDAELLPLRLELVLASRWGNLLPPVDGVTQAMNDEERLTLDALRARRLGFGAKLCIHPRQVGKVREAFLPSASEIAWALRVIDAAQAAGGAAVAVDGKMVDLPVLRKARALLAAMS